MRGANPVEVFCPEGESRLRRLPMLSPRRRANSSPTTRPGVSPCSASAVALPAVMSERMPSTSGADTGSMPRNTSPFTPWDDESITSVYRKGVAPVTPGVARIFSSNGS